MNRNMMKNYKIIAGLVSFAAVFGVSNAANAKSAKCDISLNNGKKGEYKGPCDFDPLSGGSFMVTMPRPKKIFFANINAINVYVGDYAGLPKDQALLTYNVGAITIDYGQLFRSKSKPACWVNQVHRICVY